MSGSLFNDFVYLAAFGFLFWSDWRVAIGVLLFGWAMNLENTRKETLQ